MSAVIKSLARLSLFAFMAIAVTPFAGLDSANAEQVCTAKGSKSPGCMERSRLKTITVSVKQLREAGIFPQSVIAKSGRPLPGLAIECDVVPNGWGMTLSKDLYTSYTSRGFSSDAVCLGMGGGGIYFDPETGEQLPLYVVAGDAFKDIHPARLPDCFKKIERVGGIGSWLIYFRPSGCEMKYHPTTGKKLSGPDQVFLAAGGEAGGGVDEDAKNSSVSEERLKQLVQGK